MRLSDAMILGSTMDKLELGDIDHCGLGVAGTAVGIPLSENLPQETWRSRLIGERWPWLTSNEDKHGINIAWLFDYKVCTGKMTFDALVAYVKSIEPRCGECNTFDCCCTRAAVAFEVETQTELTPQ